MSDADPSAHANLTAVRNLYAAVGEAMSGWAHVEIMLTALAGHCLRLPNPGHVHQFTKNFRGPSPLIDFADAAIVVFLPENDPRLNYWKPLKGRLFEMCGDRNYIAHTPLTLLSAGPPTPESLAAAVPHLGPSFQDFYVGTKQSPMDETEVLELAVDFRQAADMIEAFMQVVVQPPPWPETYLEPPAFRRPKRSDRHGNK